MLGMATALHSFSARAKVEQNKYRAKRWGK
jgi:hypothetical protein